MFQSHFLKGMYILSTLFAKLFNKLRIQLLKGFQPGQSFQLPEEGGFFCLCFLQNNFLALLPYLQDPKQIKQLKSSVGKA